MKPGRIGPHLAWAAMIALSFEALTPAVFAQDQPTYVKPASRADERPQTPSALGRYGAGGVALLASQRGGASMGGGLDRPGRWHLTVRAFAQTNARGLPASDMVEYASGDPSPTFDDPTMLVEVFKAALARNEIVAFAGLLGLQTARVLDDAATLEAYLAIRDGAAKKLEINDQGGSQILVIGEEGWPFPYPMVRDDDNRWSFDTLSGLQEIVNRRIGENELQAIATARAFLDAQRAYASQDRDGDGVREYAQKLVSSEGVTDGIWWPGSLGYAESPGGDFLQAAEQRDGYFGYRYRILTGQGKNMPGGSHDYLINDNMIAGYALVAWPASYARSGLHTFLVSHHGTVYAADLGAPTAAIVPHIERINPGEEWIAIAE
jgi:hypothetical protein